MCEGGGERRRERERKLCMYLWVILITWIRNIIMSKLSNEN
jgi:predicted nucleic acid-binding Zn ribbon protein